MNLPVDDADLTVISIIDLHRSAGSMLSESVAPTELQSSPTQLQASEDFVPQKNLKNPTGSLGASQCSFVPDTVSEASESRGALKFVDVIQLQNSRNSRASFEHHDQVQSRAAMEVCPTLAYEQGDCKDGVVAASTVSALQRSRPVSELCKTSGNSQNQKVLHPGADMPAIVTPAPKGIDPPDQQLSALPSRPLIGPLPDPVSTMRSRLSTSCATDTEKQPLVHNPSVQALEISDDDRVVANLLEACVDDASFAVAATFTTPAQTPVCTTPQ